MIVRVLDAGRNAPGLTRYLFGPGKANEHTNQRLVAGSNTLCAEWGGGPLSMAEATHLGRMVEIDWRRQRTPELALSRSRSAIAGGDTHLRDAEQAGDVHVFHASISLAQAEGPYTDEQWREVAENYVRGMGFTDDPKHPDASWFAVNHGLSTNGNDHIHIVVSTVRRDGSTISLSNTGLRSQEVRRNVLERLEYVTPLHDANRPENAPKVVGYTAAEHNKARERAKLGTGSATPDRVQLQRIVRAAASQSTTEAQWINAVTSHPGVHLEVARWQPGGTDLAYGYKVSLDDGPAFSASKLATDLTLPKLRSGWTETPQSLQHAQDLWHEVASLDRVTATSDVPPQLEQAARQLKNFNDALGQLDVQDQPAWNHALNSLAGTTAVLSTGREFAVDADGKPTGFGPDAGRAADVLARQALAVPMPVGAVPVVPTGLSGAEQATRSIQLALRAGGTSKHAGWLAVIQQMNRSIDAVRDAQRARGELAAARTLTDDARTALTRLERYLEHTTSDGATGPGSVTTERTSERLLREQKALERTTAGMPPAAEMTDEARRASDVAGHATETTQGSDALEAGTAATFARGDDNDKKKTQQRRRP